MYFGQILLIQTTVFFKFIYIDHICSHSLLLSPAQTLSLISLSLRSFGARFSRALIRIQVRSSQTKLSES